MAEWTSESASASNYAPDTAILRSVRPKISAYLALANIGALILRNIASESMYQLLLISIY